MAPGSLNVYRAGNWGGPESEGVSGEVTMEHKIDLYSISVLLLKMYRLNGQSDSELIYVDEREMNNV